MTIIENAREQEVQRSKSAAGANLFDANTYENEYTHDHAHADSNLYGNTHTYAAARHAPRQSICRRHLVRQSRLGGLGQCRSRCTRWHAGSGHAQGRYL